MQVNFTATDQNQKPLTEEQGTEMKASLVILMKIRSVLSATLVK